MKLKQEIEEALTHIIDPETGMDVIRMQLVRDLQVNENGEVSLTFSPSSPVCPLAFQLAIDIQETIKSVEGVTDIEIKVQNYSRADELQKILGENR